MSVSAYPLQWPAGLPRTHTPTRSAFGDVTIHRAGQELLWEIQRMQGRHIVISSNIELRNDGLPYSKQRPISDHGVAAYFMRRDRQLVFACDRWDRIEHNMRAVTKTIEALRGIERWGSSDLMERAFTGFEALPAPEQWWQVLGVSQNAAKNEIRAAYRRLARDAHPDQGGSDAAMARLNAARDAGMGDGR